MLGKIRGLRALAVAATAVTVACAGGAAYGASNSTSVIVRGPLDKVSTNGGVQTPSEVFSALVNADGNHAGMSWIGTSSDGSQSGSSTISGTDITNLVCGSSCLIASLDVSSISSRTLVLRTNAATSSITEKYVINIWY
jgi:hypothetical protein